MNDVVKDVISLKKDVEVFKREIKELKKIMKDVQDLTLKVERLLSTQKMVFFVIPVFTGIVGYLIG